MTNAQLIARLQDVLGEDKVAINASKTEHYRTGWRSGGGSALAVVFPDNLLSFWRVLQACVDANCIMIMQAANTGLTEALGVATTSGIGYL